jgi:hypothetical protein
VGEKANPAVFAGNNAIPQFRMGLQDRVQGDLILPDERPGAVVPVPIRPKRENLFQSYGKKTRFSVIIAKLFDTPSSYLIDAKASRGRARFFMQSGGVRRNVDPTNAPVRIADPGSIPCQIDADSLRSHP